MPPVLSPLRWSFLALGISLPFLPVISNVLLAAQGPHNDPAARKFLKEAEEKSASWDGFPGFRADVKVFRDGKTHSGNVTITKDGKVRLELADDDAKKWALQVLSSIAVTSTRRPFEDRYKDVGVSFGADDLHPLGQLVRLHGDPYNTRYRILDGEIRVIEREMPQHNMFLHILTVERDENGDKKARSFIVYYFDKKTNALLRSESIVDRRVSISGFVLPSSWKEIRVRDKNPSTSAIFLSDHQLLPEGNGPSNGVSNGQR